MREENPQRAFDGKAGSYARSRFEYAPLAIDAIVAIAKLDRKAAVADLGAGTGMLTRHFAGRVGRLYAVEPNDDMLAVARVRLGDVETVDVIKGTADATGLASRSVDAVTAGRSLQWFDPDPSLEEIRRILRPGGWLVVVRTPPTDAASIAAIERLREAHDLSPARNSPPDAGAFFVGDDCIRLRFPCAVRESWPQFIDRVRSFSFSPHPTAPAYGAFESLARELFDRDANEGTLEVRYATEVLMKQIAVGEAPQRRPRA